MKKQEKYSSIKHKVHFVTTVISWTIFILLILVAIVLLYYFIATKVYANKNPDYKASFGLYTIISPSMEPNLNIYDVIVNVKVKKPEDIKVGDVITFISTSTISKGFTITHRVYSITNDENGYQFQTKGDNNEVPDSATVRFENIIGKVIFKIPQLGRLQSILTTRWGWLILVVIPAFLIILFDILKLIRLQSAQKDIADIVLKEEQKKEENAKKKKEIEEKLNSKYGIKRSENEEDPLKKTSVIIEVGKNKKNKKIEDIPKLKEPKKKKKK